MPLDIRKLVPATTRRFIKRTLGLQSLAERVNALELAVRQEVPAWMRGADGISPMTVLEGTPYARYLMPLDYPPSRHFTPRWGYSAPPIKRIRELYAQHDDRYRGVLEGIRALSSWLQRIPLEFKHEHLPRPGWIGGPIAPIDSAALYYFVSHFKPRTYLEVGSGLTTCFARRAIADHGLSTRIVSIDPEPRAEIDSICDQVIRTALEEADLTPFADLEPGDIVFIDGSHRSFMNSDVTVFMIDVLPALRPGVVVHLHDITLPYDYSEGFKQWYWNEQYILAVYLMAAHDRILPLFPSAYVCREPHFGPLLETPILDIGQTWKSGGSLWFTHTAQERQPV